MHAAHNTAQDIQRAPAAPSGAASNPAAAGKVTWPTRLPSRRSAKAAPREAGGTAWVTSVIVIGCPRPRKNPQTASEAAARAGKSNVHGSSASATPAPARLEMTSVVLLQRRTRTGKSSRDEIEAAARMDKRIPTTKGAT